MNLALSKRDQSMLLGLLGAIFLFVAWYFVYTPLQEKTVALETENVALKAKADLYQSINANLPKYEEGIVEYEQQIAEIGNLQIYFIETFFHIGLRKGTYSIMIFKRYFCTARRLEWRVMILEGFAAQNL